jgi:GNAT superfamily N-acetyltransferase
MHEAARPAAEADLPEIAALYRASLSEVAAQRGGAVIIATDALREPLEDELKLLCASEHALVLAGTLDDTVVGMAVARVGDHADGSRLVRVAALYVDPPTREVGVGEALVASVLGWTAQVGAVGLDIPVLPGARVAKSFLEGEGFVARLLVMHRAIDR